MSKVDHFFRRLLLTKFFVKGWGKPDNLKSIFQFRKIISDRELCQHLVPNDYPIFIDKEEEQDECRVLTGHFLSPFNQHLPGIMPEVVKTAYFQMVLPKQWEGHLKPVCVHLPGTGDHGFWRRRTLLARPLIKHYNIASVILENPFYGLRKPKEQFRSQLNNVSDLFVMGGALVLESLALFHWLERQGFGPLGITGISLGGHNASLAASNWHKPLSLIPCLSWSTASTVFTKGVLSNSIPWDFLQREYQENDVYGTEVTKLIHSPEKSGHTKTEAFLLGQKLHEYMDKLEPSLQSSFGVRPQSGDTKVAVGRNPVNTGSGQRDSSVSTSQNSTLSSKSRPDIVYPNVPPNDKSSSASEERSSLGNNGRWNIRQRLLRSFQSHELPEEALDFMRGVMDECTHLGNFSVPVDPELIIIVSAKNDAYIPHDRVMSLQELWPGSEVRHINSGHIGAYLRNHNVFREAIKDSFDRQIEKYCTESIAQQQK